MAWPDYAAAVSADNPVAYWPFDDTGGLPRDRAANFHMTASGGTITYRQAGPITGSFGIRGTGGSAASFTTPVPANPTNNMTLECWYLAGATNANQSLLWGTGGNGFSIEGANTNKFHALVNGVTAQADCQATLSNAAYAHIVIVRSGTVWKYYVNGAVDTENAGTTAPTAPTGSVQVYAGAGVDFTFSNIALYTTVLPASRIRVHYDLGLAGGFSNFGTHRTGKGSAW
jgi:hypothetical protein